MPVGSMSGTYLKIEDSERAVFSGTVKRTVSWQEGKHFYSHKTLLTSNQGQHGATEFKASQIQEVFPVEVRSTLFLTEAEINLRNFYENKALV